MSTKQVNQFNFESFKSTRHVEHLFKWVNGETWIVPKEDFPFMNSADLLVAGKWCENKRSKNKFKEPYRLICD